MTFQITGFDIAEKIGEGGAAEVFLARRQSNGQKAALKVLHAKYTTDKSMKKRLLREAEIIGGLSHHNIVKIFQYGTVKERFYMILEYLGQGSLGEFQRYSHRQLLKFMIQVCDGVAYIHSLGIVHRDLKPSNIMFGDDGIPRLVDFGISLFANEEYTRLTHTNMVIGTLSYMSPEQQTSPADVDHRSDIYALGAILYEVFTKKKPVGRFADPRVHNPNIPEDMEKCILTCLHHDKEQRYPDVKMLQDRLLRLWNEGTFEQPGQETSPNMDFDARIGYWIQKIRNGSQAEKLEARQRLHINAVPEDISNLLSICENSDTPIRLAIIPLFGKLQAAQATDFLISQISNPLLVKETCMALAQIGDKRALPTLIQLVKKKLAHSYNALIPLAVLGSDRDLKHMLPYFRSRHYADRKAAIEAFGLTRSTNYLKDLRKFYKSEEDKELKSALAQLIRKLEFAGNS